MKIVSEDKNITKKLNDIIIKNIELRADIFKKYSVSKRHEQCIICKTRDFTVIGNQFRNIFFYNKDDEPPFINRYYTDVKYCLNDERLLSCNNCGLVFAEFSYPYGFYLDILTHLHDQSDPISYEENLLQIDKEWALDKHLARINFFTRYQNSDKKIPKLLARINFFSGYQNSNQKIPKLLEISSYRGWGLDHSKNDFDVYGVEAHEQSFEFNKIYFPDLANKIHHNLFEKSADFLNTNKNFNVILISQAFRHMKDPFKTLRMLWDILSDDGLIVVDESLFLDTIVKEYFDTKSDQQKLNSIFTHGKAFYYSQRHITYLFERSGFQFIKYEKYNSPAIEYIETDLMLFKKKENPFTDQYDDYSAGNYNNFNDIKDKYVDDQDQFKRFFINY